MTTIRRAMDAARFNEIANHPDVRPWLGGGDGPLDVSALLANVANFGLLGEHGGFLCEKLDSGLFECHSLFLPERGAGEASATANEAIRYMFAATECVELVTKVPRDNKAALGLARNMGFREVEKHEISARGFPFSRYSLTLERWRALDAGLAEIGEAFHTALEEAKAATGSARAEHPHDIAHERAVGATFLMIRAGNVIKAVRQYNRWAIFAGYAQIELLSDAPVILDIVDAIVGVSAEGRMEILKCR